MSKQTARAQTIRLTVEDLVTRFLWIDRKEDEDLPRGGIEAAIAAGEISVAEIVTLFETHLRENLSDA